MPARESVDSIEIVAVDTLLAEERLGVVARQVAERQAPEQPTDGRRPADHRAFTAREHDADGIAECGHERLLQPEVQRSEDLVSVEDEHDALAEAP